MAKKKKKKTVRKRGRSKAPVSGTMLALSLLSVLTKRPVKRRHRIIRAWSFALVGAILLGSGVAVALNIPHATGTQADEADFPPKLERQYAALSASVRDFINQEHQHNAQVVADDNVQQALSKIQLDVEGHNYTLAQTDLSALSASLKTWSDALNDEVAAANAPAPPTEAPGSRFVPIVMYHYPPDNLEQQLVYLEQHGYTTVDLGQVAAALSHGALLPAKPIVITFDDGFANQMQAFALLQKHHMKATFYIINGGAMSNWCIGAGRRYNDPLQPPSGCGDAYLSWDQVRQLDRSGLITIGGHTLDHPDLSSESADLQQHEIADSKAQIEQQVGHPIYDFAYPYGSYNQTSIDLVAQAGYRTAVTTLPGDYQAPGSLYTLKRIRDTLTLP